MNILFLTNHLNVGGITSYLLTLAKEFRRDGQRVFIASAGGEMVPEFAGVSAAHSRLDLNTSSEANPKIYWALPKLCRLIRENDIEIIHAQTRVTQVLGTILARITGRVLITTCHGFYKPKLFRRVFPCWGQKVIAISPAVREHLQKDFGVKPENIFLVRHGLDINDYPLFADSEKEERQREKGISGYPVIGIIARLAAGKGHDVLIQAFTSILSKYPRAKLVIVGAGKQKSALQQMARECGLQKNILFFPVVNRTPEFLAVFDMFVLPSLTEGLGLSVMEAQAAGLPVIASRVGGIPALIESGHNGILVEPGDSAALAEAILELLTDPARAKSLGMAGREFIEAECSAREMAQATLAVYRQAKENK